MGRAMRASDAMALLRRLEQLGIEVVPCRHAVRYRPLSAMTPDLAAEVVRLKPQLLELLGHQVDDTFFERVLEQFDGEEVEPGDGIPLKNAGGLPCHNCGARRWWRLKSGGPWICGRCHPAGPAPGLIEHREGNDV